MVFLDENNVPIFLESIDIPTVSEYFWSLSLKEKDFMLNEIITLEEMEVSSLLLAIMGYVIKVPTSWNMLIYSQETLQIDIIEVHELTKGNFSAVVYDHQKDYVVPGAGLVKVLDYIPNSKIMTPTLHKSTMLCHPIGPRHWVCVSPTDNYNKYLKGAVIGDLY